MTKYDTYKVIKEGRQIACFTKKKEAITHALKIRLATGRRSFVVDTKGMVVYEN